MDKLNTCEATEQEQELFVKNCAGKVNTTIDASTMCKIYTCDTKKIEKPDLECTDNTCVCDSKKYGASMCVTECKLQPNYLNHSINDAEHTVTCTYSKEEDVANCTELLGCCSAASLGTCAPNNSPDKCNQKPHSSIPGYICFYKQK